MSFELQDPLGLKTVVLNLTHLYGDKTKQEKVNAASLYIYRDVLLDKPYSTASNEPAGFKEYIKNRT